VSFSELLDEISELSKAGRGFKPHKHLLLLSVLELSKQGRLQGNRVYYDEVLKSEFQRLLSLHGGMQDRDRPYNPFFHLGSTTFWRLVPVAGRERNLIDAQRVGGPGILVDLVQFAELSAEMASALAGEQRCAEMEAVILRCIAAGLQARETLGRSDGSRAQNVLQRLSLISVQTGEGNPFVSYLNSLQRLSAGNENALAEFQACSEFFSRIQVAHPLTRVILDELRRPDGRQVILTGHAGDGKSTIALAVYRQLFGFSEDAPLEKQLLPREDLPGNISILKDLSERSRGRDSSLMQEILGGGRRFLIVSNTGALLDFFQGQGLVHRVSPVKMESDILTAIGADGGEADLTVGGARFLVINLARIDNLAIALQIFSRMIAPEHWEVCAGRNCRANCPICLNVDLINHRRETILNRLFIAYRRMYEYGTRLTLRQITEHLAYLVTSGLEEADIAEMRAKGLRPLKSEFMFFNRFFGDNGKADHAAAMQMRAVQEIRRQGFGERPCPTWERKLWLKLREGNFRLGVEDCDQEFELLRAHGAGPGNDSRPGMTPDQAREQVRRMLFFLYEFSADNTSFLRQFLNSPTILRWQEWQREGARLEMTEKNVLEQRIYHVLQEHFTGVRLPEGSRGHDRRLYITLSRGKSDIRQSAQVVVAQVDWSNETTLELVSRTNVAGGTRTDLELQGRGRIKTAKLALTLPFLDYVLMRHFGEVGETLQPAYVERLERFKAQIQDLATESPAHVMLVRLKTDHTFRRQQYTVHDGRLEVTDVL
jgi:hypothetical protein